MTSFNFKLPICFAVCLLLTATSLKSQTSQNQDFEGIIKFAYSYTGISENFSSKGLTKYFGDTSIAYIKGGQYKQEYPNAQGIKEVIYDYKSNRYYMVFTNIDTLFYIDASSSNETFFLESNNTQTASFMGYSCKSISVYSSFKDTTLYFYSPELSLSAKPFKNHTISGYNLLTEHTKSVYLAMFYSCKDYKARSIAFSLEKKRLEDSVFYLPNLPIKKL